VVDEHNEPVAAGRPSVSAPAAHVRRPQDPGEPRDAGVVENLDAM
jgi:hypothetical protein